MVFLGKEGTYLADSSSQAEIPADFPYTRGYFFPFRSKVFTDFPCKELSVETKETEITNIVEIRTFLDTYDKCLAVSENNFGDKSTVCGTGCNC